MGEGVLEGGGAVVAGSCACVCAVCSTVTILRSGVRSLRGVQVSVETSTSGSVLDGYELYDLVEVRRPASPPRTPPTSCLA